MFFLVFEAFRELKWCTESILSAICYVLTYKTANIGFWNFENIENQNDCLRPSSANIGRSDPQETGGCWGRNLKIDRESKLSSNAYYSRLKENYPATLSVSPKPKIFIVSKTGSDGQLYRSLEYIVNDFPVRRQVRYCYCCRNYTTGDI